MRTTRTLLAVAASVTLTAAVATTAPAIAAKGGKGRPAATYAQQNGGLSGLRLVPGTEPFSPIL